MAKNEAEIKLTAKDRTRKAFVAANARMDKLKSSAGRLRGAFVALAGVAGIAAATKSFLTFADQVGKSADAINISTKELQQYRFAAEQSGITNSTLDQSFLVFSKRLGELKNGFGPLFAFAAKYDKNLAETLKTTDDYSQALKLLFARMNELKSSTDKTTLANAAFGRSGLVMTVMLNKGVRGLEAMKKEALDLGIVVREKLIRESEKTNDMWNIFTKILRTATGEMVSGMIPSLQSLAQYLTQNGDALREFGRGLGAAIEGLGKAAVKTGQFFGAIRKGFSDFKLLSARTTAGVDASAENIKKLEKHLKDWTARVKEAKKEGGVGGWFITRRGKAEIQFATEALKKFNEQFERAEIMRKRQEFDASKKPAEKPISFGSRFKGTKGAQLESQKALLAKQVFNLEMSFMAEKDKLLIHLSEKELIIQEAFEKGVLTKIQRNEIMSELERQTQEKITQINATEADKRLAKEKQIQSAIYNAKNRAINAGIGLLHVLGQRSKTAAKLALIISKGRSIAQIIHNTSVAATRALAEMGPILGPPAAAKIKLWGGAEAALVAGTGLAELGNAGGGGPGLGGIEGGGGGVGFAEVGRGGEERVESKIIRVNLGDEDDLMTKGAVRKFMERMQEQLDEGFIFEFEK